MDEDDNKQYGYSYCSSCKKQTATLKPSIYKTLQTTRSGTNTHRFLLKGICPNCTKIKSKQISLIHVNKLPDNVKNLEIGKSLTIRGSGILDDLISTILPLNPLSMLSPIIQNQINPSPIENSVLKGEGILENTGDGILDTVEDFVGPTIRSSAKNLVSKVPIIGDLVNQSGLLDSALDWAKEKIWDPIKRFFGGSFDDDEIVELIKQNKGIMKNIINASFEDRINTKDDSISNYLRNLRNGSEEDKTLENIITKTILKPKFVEFVKSNNISNDTNLDETVKQYVTRYKSFKAPLEKSIDILKENDYIII